MFNVQKREDPRVDRNLFYSKFKFGVLSLLNETITMLFHFESTLTTQNEIIKIKSLLLLGFNL